MLGMKNHFDISGSIEIREVDIAGVACNIMHRNCSRCVSVLLLKHNFLKCFKKCANGFQPYVFFFLKISKSLRNNGKKLGQIRRQIWLFF